MCEARLVMQMKVTIAAALLVASGYGVFVYVHRVPKFSEADAVILGDFSNATGQTIFDGSLREALGVSLAQSPYFTVVSGEKVIEALRASGRPPEQPITRDLAQSICASTKAKAFVTPAISSEDG